MLRKLFLLISLFLLIGTVNVSAYTLEGDSVYINNSKVYINVTPHTLNSDGWIELSFVSKIISGDIDVLFGFNTTQIIPKNPYFQKINQTIINGTPMNISYWKSFSIDDIINKSYDGKDTWYVIKNFNVSTETEYKIKFFLKIFDNGKYDVAIKLSSDSMQQAIDNNRFLLIDPWWNDTSMVNTNCTINEWEDNGSSTANVNYNGSLRTGYVFEDNIISYWRFRDNNARDENCLADGIINGATFTSSGKIGGAYSFGATDYIDTATVSGILTIAHWFNPNVNITKSTNPGYLWRENGGTPYLAIGGNWAGAYADEMVTYVVSGVTSQYWTDADIGTDSFDNGTWHHLALVREVSSETIRLYYNGVDKGQARNDTGSNWDTIIGDLYIGASAQAALTDIDEVVFYDKSLSSADISIIYNGSNGIVHNSSAINFFSIINRTASDMSWFVPTINCTENNFNCWIRVSTDNSTYTNWLTEANNSENISVTPGDDLSFQINLSGNGTISATFDNWGVISDVGVTDSCTPPSINNDWDVNISDNCVIAQDVDLGTGALIIFGNNGSFEINSTYSISANDIKFTPDDFDGDFEVNIKTGATLAVKP
jgi:hypothetical protein